MPSLLDSPAGRAVLLLAVLGVSTLVWLVLSRRSGRFSVRATGDGTWVDAVLPDGPGTVATFVQLSSAVCTPCRRTAAVLHTIVEQTPGVRHVELDVADHDDLVRALGVMRTPTVLLLGPSGDVRSRTSGPVTRAQALEALASLTAPSLPAPDPTSVSQEAS